MTHFRRLTENMTFFPISPLLLQRFVREYSSLRSVRWRQKIGKQTAAGVFPRRRFPSVDLLICCRTVCTGT